jgi:excisionase family DNA binding protein
MFCRHLSATHAVDMATTGMDMQPSSLRTELELMTEHELARHLKVCRRQLYSWRMAGLIPYFKIGRGVRFRVAEVLRALDGMRG